MESEPEWLAELRVQVRERSDPWVVLEGRRAVESAIAGWWDISGILAGECCEWDPPAWSGLELLRRPREVVEEVGGETLHHGVLGLARLPDETGRVAGWIDELDADAVVVVCPDPRDAAAAGRLVRTAGALGAQGILFGNEGASPFEREAVRASGEALFQLPVRVADGGLILRSLKAGGFSLLGLDEAKGTANPQGHIIPAGRVALVIGPELKGLDSFWQRARDRLLAIPPAPGMVPLDPAAAAAVLLWEIRRRREEEEGA